MCSCVYARPNICTQEGDGAVMWWMWLAPGCIGVVFITLGAWVGPQLGYSLFFVCVVCGQLTGSAWLDHVAWLDNPHSDFTTVKAASMAVIVAGCVLGTHHTNMHAHT